MTSQPPGGPYRLAALCATDSVDRTIHQNARLGIMSMLVAAGVCDFVLLKAELNLSDGNLSTHLAILEERGYISGTKEFIRRRPRTRYRATPKGRAAFANYVTVLERIVQAAHADQSSSTANDEAAIAPNRGQPKDIRRVPNH